MCEIEERRVRVTDVEDHDLQRLRSAAIVTGHFYVGGLHECLARFDRYRRAAFQLQCEGTLQDVNRDRESVRMKNRPVTRFEARGDDTHLLPVSTRHARDNFAM